MSNQTSLRILLTRSEVGRLIGIGAESIRRLRRENNTNIEIDKDIINHRVVALNGEFIDVTNVIEEILDITEPTYGSISKKTLKVLMQDELCKVLVQKGKQVLETIMKKSRTRMKVNPAHMPGSTERILEITEDKGNVTDGIRVLFTEIDMNQSSPNEINYKAERETKENENNYKDSVKLEIGKIWNLMSGTNLIAGLRKRVGVKISVEQNEVITIEGDKGAVQMCKSILCAQMATFSSFSPNKNIPSTCEGPDTKSTATALAMRTNLR